jgi:23S rRNA C2498 (ribose-2'-O)-methylase RlmM
MSRFVAARSRPLYVGSPDTQDLLVAELRRRGDAVVVAPGFVQSALKADPVFARSVLWRPVFVRAQSLTDLATSLLALERAASFSDERIQVFAPELLRTGSADKSQHPLATDARHLLEVLQKKSTGRREKGKAPPPSAHVLRVALVESRACWASVDEVGAHGDADDPLLSWPGPFSGGRAIALEAARDAPSSAHRKLQEAFAWLGRTPSTGDVAVDLGAAPGGWTRVLRDQGARVVAVDRGELHESLQRDSLVTWLRRDALDVDLAVHGPTWVVCDVIWAPQHTLKVLGRAMALPSVRGVVATLKLTRPVDFSVLDAAVDLVSSHSAFEGRVKHLVANKQEVTLMMRRR